MNFDKFTSLAYALWLEHLKVKMPTILALGSPGIGKTSAARSIAALITAHHKAKDAASHDALCHILDLSSMQAEDLMGLPYTEESKEIKGIKTTRYAPQSWLAEICNPASYGVLVFDDLPAASLSVQVATRQAALERRIGEHKIAPGIMIIVTGNRREDKSAAVTLPAHFRNSVLTVTLEPDLTTWGTWYHDQGWDNLITQFLTYRPSHFSRLPADADSQGVFATPRSWSMLGSIYPVAAKTDSLQVCAAGLVGEGIAIELAAFELVRRQLVAPEDVLNNPKGSLPSPQAILDSPDKLISMVTGLADTTIRLGALKEHKKVHEQYLLALAHICASVGDEYLPTSISTFLAHRGDFQKLRTAVVAVKNEPEVKRMMAALAECFKDN
jgi:hypothetical protein